MVIKTIHHFFFAGRRSESAFDEAGTRGPSRGKSGSHDFPNQTFPALPGAPSSLARGARTRRRSRGRASLAADLARVGGSVSSRSRRGGCPAFAPVEGRHPAPHPRLVEGARVVFLGPHHRPQRDTSVFLGPFAMPNPVPASSYPSIPERPMRPMDAGDLIARAIELCSSFNPARVTLDAHADERLAAWNVRHADDATFLRQILYGDEVPRLPRRLRARLHAPQRRHRPAQGQGHLRRVRVLALLRLEELGFPQFR